MIDDHQLHKQKFRISRYYDSLLLVLLSFLSLIFYASHWLTSPPGISGDASRLGLYAFDFLQEKLVPFYIYHQFAPNPLIIYIQSLVFTAFGFSNGALRSVTIVGGALATPAIYFSSLWLFRDQGAIFARRAGLIAALGLGLSTFFASFSRYGIEISLLPVVELMSVAFLWRGFRRGRTADFILAGVFVGISQYVYIVARFFPVALAVASIGAILANRQLLSRWRGLILATISATIVALPQWTLFITNPYTFTARTQQAAGQFVFSLPNPLPIITAKLTNQLLMLGWYWDNAYNPFSYRSLLTPVLVVGLVVSVAVTLYKKREAGIFSLAMMAAMLLPDLLAYEGTTPSATRLAPAIPFVFIMAGLGCAVIWGWIDKIPRLPYRVGSLVLVLVLLSGLIRQWDYAYRVKPQILAADGLEWRASLVEIAEAEYIAGHLDTPILLPSSEYQRAPLAFLLAAYFPHRASGMNEPLTQGEVVTVIQPVAPDRPTTEGIPSGYMPDEWVLLKDKTAYFFPPIPNSIEPIDDQVLPITASNNALAAEAFSARWQGIAPEYIPLSASFANHLSLVGYESGDFVPGRPLDLTFYWQPTQKIEEDVEVFVQVLDRNQQVIAALHSWPLHGAFRIRAWHPNEIMPISYSLPLPDGLSPGPYRLTVGTFNLIQHKPIPLSTGENSQLVKILKIPLPTDNRVPESLADVNFGGVIALNGYTLAAADDGLKTTFFWQAIDSPQTDYTSFIHLIDATGQIAAQSDAQPRNGQYPTSIWSSGEVVTDDRTIGPIPPGVYQVYIGWYRWDTLDRLQIVSHKSSATDDRFLLGTITLP